MYQRLFYILKTKMNTNYITQLILLRKKQGVTQKQMAEKLGLADSNTY